MENKNFNDFLNEIKKILGLGLQFNRVFKLKTISINDNETVDVLNTISKLLNSNKLIERRFSKIIDYKYYDINNYDFKAYNVNGSFIFIDETHGISIIKFNENTVRLLDLNNKIVYRYIIDEDKELELVNKDITSSYRKCDKNIKLFNVAFDILKDYKYDLEYNYETSILKIKACDILNAMSEYNLSNMKMLVIKRKSLQIDIDHINKILSSLSYKNKINHINKIFKKIDHKNKVLFTATINKYENRIYIKYSIYNSKNRKIFEIRELFAYEENFSIYTVKPIDRKIIDYTMMNATIIRN